ncbi:MAG: VOC family protein [Hyphomicrobiaceae bacterium]
MTMRSIIGLDHVVIMVRDLAEGGRRWQSLGFTVAPRGLHTAEMGTANHTIMLGEDYLELIGVVAETDRNLPGRQFLARRGEGIERAAFTGTDADDGVAELKARGFAALGPWDFGRPVDLPDGRKSEARFRTFVWPVEERPGGLRVFACQHLTRENVWIPELTRHANTARRIVRVEMLSPDPAKAAAHMGRLIDRMPEPLPDGALRVATGGKRGDFVFLDRATLERRHPGVPLGDLPEETAITLALEVADVRAAAKAVASKAAVVSDTVVKVAPAEASGVILELAGA